MTLPLYKNNAAPQSRPERAHAGLWYDKFCNQWPWDPGTRRISDWSLKAFPTGEGKNRQEINPKLTWIRTVAQIETVAGRGGKTIGDERLLAEYVVRVAALAGALGGHALSFATASRFVTGLGREHPVENGFAWHHALGVPYLPGSSVKGLVRAWIESGWNNETVDSTTFHRIFGSDYRKGSAQHNAERDLAPHRGSVIFLDAPPTEPVRLEPEVMTPHFGDYYQDESGKTPPADWLSPNPIPFLVVAAGQPFQFAVVPRAAAAVRDCQEVADWLAQALERIGAGAKTAVGYGRFTAPESVAERGAKLAGQAAHSPARTTPSLPAVPPLLQRVRAVASDRLPSERDQLIRDVEASKDPEVQRACARDICARYPKKKWREAAGKPWRQALERLAD